MKDPLNSASSFVENQATWNIELEISFRWQNFLGCCWIGTYAQFLLAMDYCL